MPGYFPTARSIANIVPAGDFGLNPWQRGTIFISPVADNAKLADRFKYRSAGVQTCSAGRNTVAMPTVAQAGKLITASATINVTGTNNAPAAGDFMLLRHTIEGNDWQYLAQIPFKIGFWHKSNGANRFCVALNNSGTDRGIVFPFQHNVANAWEYSVFSVPASPAAGTWNYTTGIGVTLDFVFMAGATYNAPAPGVWTNGVFLNINTLDNSAFNGIFLELADLTVLPDGYDLYRPSAKEILAHAQRYYWKTFDQGVTPATAAGFLGSVGYTCIRAGVLANNIYMLPYPVEMRVAPAFTFYSTVNANANWYNSALAADSAAGAVVGGTTGTRNSYLSNPQVAGDAIGANITIHLAADAEL